MLILGSSSPYRKAQLEQLHIPFQCYSPEVNEELIKNSHASPFEISRELSLLKAKEVLKTYPDDIIIGGDQILNFNGEIFSKPKTVSGAVEQLTKLSGNTHELITSYALISKDKVFIDTVISKMTMRELSQQQIEKYISIDSPLSCCGSYMLEALGIALFSKIDCPDHSAIIGMPLISLSTNLQNFGIEVL